MRKRGERGGGSEPRAGKLEVVVRCGCRSASFILLFIQTIFPTPLILVQLKNTHMHTRAHMQGYLQIRQREYMRKEFYERLRPRCRYSGSAYFTFSFFEYTHTHTHVKIHSLRLERLWGWGEEDFSSCHTPSLEFQRRRREQQQARPRLVQRPRTNLEKMKFRMICILI